MSEIPRSDPDRFGNPIDGEPTEESADTPQWRKVFEESTPGLRAFLKGRLTQDSDVDDCLQVVFVKMLQSGGQVARSARRAWLFRVAANESARMWRSKASADKMLQRHGAEESDEVDPTEQLILTETTQTLHQALSQLPETWQEVVRLRINENLTFQQIADQLDIPLGTALTRMRRALERLKSEMESDES
jgi:RNA polymerase sigma-70 factor (ECF subfamily)